MLANLVIMSHAHAVSNHSESREFTIRVSEVLYRNIEQLAALRGVSVGNVVEDALNRHLAIESSASTILQVHREALRRLGEE
ncbi:MAG: ribbon-helix-helix protein, CopG family [Acidimicrobiia bacterium]|nr:ribbon-helix-helix protein, CopG family [Acidimicrobiia bacterium]NCZ68102.1 ribbon-helix-helix protein, CopG family [Acidimicrobiia bacterium]